MATRIELPMQLVQDALATKIASTKRAANAATNPLIKDVLQKELAALETAKNTLAEVK